jgi:hypothetical protein
VKRSISNHAIERYQTRVDALSHDAAALAIADLLTDARIRPKPRHWMRDATCYGHGQRFAYSPRAPHVCLIIRSGCVVTVVTRSLCRLTRAGRPERRQHRETESRRPHARRRSRR